MSQTCLRAAAAKVIVAVEKGASLSVVLPEAELKVDKKQHPLLKQLCYGTLRNYYSLSFLRNKLLLKPLRTKDADINALILIGLWQLIYSRIAAHAAVKATVDAAISLNKQWAKNLVNAVLRNMQRQQESLIQQVKNSNLVDRYEHPQWLIEAYQKSWPDQWQNILENNNLQAPMALRINERHISSEKYMHLLAQEKFSARKSVLAKNCIILDQACHVEKLPGFLQGWVSVQDEGAQLSASLLNCQPGQRVLDVCAAPGGKTCQVLEEVDDLDLWAIDIEEKRLNKLKDNLNRLNLTAHVVSGDATKPDLWWNGKLFDRILLDPPCSATGVIRRHPDIKLLRRKEDITQLALLQKKMLENAWKLLKPEGLLVYVTCSVLQEENSQQIENFLSQQQNAIFQPILPQYCNYSIKFGMQLLPLQNQHDGFFYSVLRKKL